ncbi:hypothetical protein ABIA14_002728 [Sinorhizobium fredii]
MAKLWQVEETVRGQSPDARVAVRQQASAAIVTELFALWQQTLPRISGKSKLAEAIRYAISRRAIFERFLADGRIELDSNIVERRASNQAPGHYEKELTLRWQRRRRNELGNHRDAAADSEDEQR